MVIDMSAYLDYEGMRFKRVEASKFYFPNGCFITPIYEFGNIVRLLMIDKNGGGSYYKDVDVREMKIKSPCTVISLPQGVSYHINEMCEISILDDSTIRIS